MVAERPEDVRDSITEITKVEFISLEDFAGVWSRVAGGVGWEEKL